MTVLVASPWVGFGRAGRCSGRPVVEILTLVGVASFDAIALVMAGIAKG